MLSGRLFAQHAQGPPNTTRGELTVAREHTILDTNTTPGRRGQNTSSRGAHEDHQQQHPHLQPKSPFLTGAHWILTGAQGILTGVSWDPHGRLTGSSPVPAGSSRCLTKGRKSECSLHIQISVRESQSTELLQAYLVPVKGAFVTFSLMCDVGVISY